MEGAFPSRHGVAEGAGVLDDSVLLTSASITAVNDNGDDCPLVEFTALSEGRVVNRISDEDVGALSNLGGRSCHRHGDERGNGEELLGKHVDDSWLVIGMVGCVK